MFFLHHNFELLFSKQHIFYIHPCIYLLSSHVHCVPLNHSNATLHPSLPMHPISNHHQIYYHQPNINTRRSRFRHLHFRQSNHWTISIHHTFLFTKSNTYRPHFRSNLERITSWHIYNSRNYFC